MGKQIVIFRSSEFSGSSELSEISKLVDEELVEPFDDEQLVDPFDDEQLVGLVDDELVDVEPLAELTNRLGP